MARTGKFTGRSPHDKFIVRRSPSASHINWGAINKPCSEATFDALQARCTTHLSGKPLYVFDGFAGNDPELRLHVRVVAELAWQAHFCANMLVNPDPAAVMTLAASTPDFVIINACRVRDEAFAEHGLHSETFVLFDLERGRALIGDTHYGGEMKKGVFSVMNYLMPLRGCLPMHCSANRDRESGDVALFFGLSGTGKTTLSADPTRLLIGDDEHVWSDSGISNIEGGCYAKTVALRAEFEPEIVAAIRPGAVLENVVLGPDGVPDYDDIHKTENGRVAYPLSFIGPHEPSARGGHPRHIVFLACDAYGVLPAVARLSEPGRAVYYFLSGYTAKVAGTERGIKEPQATFSFAFGDVFMPHHATVYARLLADRIERHGVRVYLVNTGWAGGPYGEGSRMSITATRACVRAVLDGSIEHRTFRVDPTFGFDVPVDLPGVPDTFLDPRTAWTDAARYDEQADKLAAMFIRNYDKLRSPGFPDYSAFGPRPRSD